MKNSAKIFAVLFFAFAIVLSLSACTSQPTEEAATAAEETEKATEAAKAAEAATEAAEPEEAAPVNYELPVTGVGPSVTTDVKAKEKFVISAITKNSVNPYMVKNLEGAQKAAEDMGCEIVILSPSKQDSVEEQVTIMEAMMARGVQAMVIHPSDSMGIMPGVRKAQEQGILISTIGTPAAEETFLRSGVDYYLTGQKIAERMAEELGGQGKIIVLEGAPGAQNGQERLQGIKDKFDEYEGIEIVASQTANWNRVQGMSITENLLQRFPDVGGVIGCNDEMAIGAIQALKAAGLNDVLVAGFDANKDACIAIQSGDMLASYNTDPFGSAYLAAVYMVQYLNDGTEPPEYFVPFPSEDQNPMIDGSNVDEFMTTDAWWIE